MDRDQRWERTERAFDVVTGRGGPLAQSAMHVVETSHANGVTDEFIEPTRIGDWGVGVALQRTSMSPTMSRASNRATMNEA